MNNRLNISTITPVHIGSGMEFQGKNEYVYFPKEKCVAVIDEAKVLAIIEPHNIQHWIDNIQVSEPKNRKSILTLPQMQNVKAEQIAKRILSIESGYVEEIKALRGQIHSGNGMAMLPGTSLKGALRTALFANHIRNDKNNLIKRSNNLGRTDQQGNVIRFDDTSLSKIVFGNSPNEDILRLLQVGDTHFTKTAFYRTESINLKYKKWEIKESITQQVEAIPAGMTATTRLVFNDLLEKQSISKRLFNDNSQLLVPEKLFPLVNAHTQKIVENELSFWRDGEKNPELLGDFVDKLEEILNIIKNIKQGKEAVIRIGWGTGFHSMTGGWTNLLDDEFYYALVKSVRWKHPDNLLFPKTMRFISGGEPLGFVKLSL
jgi:CRISPR-associated protein Csm5